MSSMTNSGPNSPVRRPGCACSIGTILATIVVFLVLSFVYNLITGVPAAPDYPGATKADLTAAGNQFVDSLYQNNKRENSTIKVFLTNDAPEQVLNFYTAQLVDKNGFTSGEKAIRQLPGAIAIVFNKKDSSYALITSNSQDNLVQNQQPNQTYIIVAQGRS